MSIAELLPSLAAAVDATWKRLGAIGSRIDELDQAASVVKNSQPHTEDMIRQKRLELDNACLRFQSRTAEQSKIGAPSLGQSLSDPDAQAYYLRDQISAQIPNEVERLFPSAKNGMKQADRNKALADIDKEKAALIAEREALLSEKSALRRIVMGRTREERGFSC